MTSTTPPVVVLLAPPVGHLQVDALSGAVTEDARGARLGAPDAAALEVALTIASQANTSLCAVSAGGSAALESLAMASEVGVDRLVHVVVDDNVAPLDIAAHLASFLSNLPPALIVAGAHGADFGSAIVPAAVAHHLGAQQALGLVAVQRQPNGSLTGLRRLDGGARERLAVHAPAVISVEGGVASLRRGTLGATLRASSSPVETFQPQSWPGSVVNGSPQPYRPQPLVVAPPVGDAALDRVRVLTGAGQAASPARSVELSPEDAAEAILDRLGAWGYGPRSTPNES